MKNNGTKTVTTVIFNNNKVLLVKNIGNSNHPDGIYGLPAGRVESGETWKQAAKRECSEESGIIPLKLIKLPTFYVANLKRKSGKIEKFCCWSFYCPKFEGQVKSSDETLPEWVELSEVKKLPLIANVDKMIDEAKLYAEL